MMAGTSPSVIATFGGGYEIAFQANTGMLWTAGKVRSGNTDLGVATGTSPSITVPANGGYEIAFQAYTPPPPPPSTGGSSGKATPTGPAVVTVPVYVVIPAPAPAPPPAAPGHKRLRRLKVKLALSWTWNHARSRLTHIQLGHLPRSAHVVTTCRGHGCPVQATQASARKLSHLVAAAGGIVYHAGDRIYITITAPGYRSERAEVLIHNGAIPSAKLV
jgi:hypothetical protein